MKNTFKLLLFGLLLFAFNGAQAADLKKIAQLFSKTFWTDVYEENQCGSNIERLTMLAMERKLNLDGAMILGMRDPVGSTFGMVNAISVREGGRPFNDGRTQPPFRNIGEKNWYHHVALYVDGYIMDYDFTNAPRVVPFLQYLHEMYIPQNRHQDKEYKFKKMRLFELEFYPAEEYIKRRQSRISTKPILTEVLLKDFLPAFYN